MQNIYTDISSPILPVQRQTNEKKFVTSGGHCVIPPKISFTFVRNKTLSNSRKRMFIEVSAT